MQGPRRGQRHRRRATTHTNRPVRPSEDLVCNGRAGPGRLSRVPFPPSPGGQTWPRPPPPGSGEPDENVSDNEPTEDPNRGSRLRGPAQVDRLGRGPRGAPDPAPHERPAADRQDRDAHSHGRSALGTPSAHRRPPPGIACHVTSTPPGPRPLLGATSPAPCSPPPASPPRPARARSGSGSAPRP